MGGAGVRARGQGTQPGDWRPAVRRASAAVRLHRHPADRQGRRPQSHQTAPQGGGQGGWPRLRQGQLRLCPDRPQAGTDVGVRRDRVGPRQGTRTRAPGSRARAVGQAPADRKRRTLMDLDNQKNLLVAIVLSVAVLLMWQMFYAGPKLKEDQERRQRIQQEQQTQPKEQPGAPKSAVPQTAPGAIPQPGTAAPSVVPPAAPAPTREAALQASPRLRIDTPSLKGSIALKGGRIDDLVLAKYHETVDPKSANVVLFSPSGAPHPYYAEYGWVAGG